MVNEATVEKEKQERSGEATVLNVLAQMQKQVQALSGHELDVVHKDVRDLATALKSESVFNKILHSIGKSHLSRVGFG